jgi:hypothetical protein
VRAKAKKTTKPSNLELYLDQHYTLVQAQHQGATGWRAKIVLAGEAVPTAFRGTKQSARKLARETAYVRLLYIWSSIIFPWDERLSYHQALKSGLFDDLRDDAGMIRLRAFPNPEWLR